MRRRARENGRQPDRTFRYDPVARAVARFAGLINMIDCDPGAYAPGFMLPPASQAPTSQATKSISSACFAGPTTQNL